ncbi:M23 family metallopeptidase [Patescibacteria group bacterium]|nr:M23 family metallopeptidase [Patescibacteria group bacterium]
MISDKLKFHAKNLYKIVKRTFRKEPFFCLIIGLVVFSFGVCIFSSNLALKTLGDFSFLASAVDSGQVLFAQPFNNFLRESPSMTFIGENSLVAITPPSMVDTQVLGSLLGGVEDEMMGGERKDILEYTVEEGETLSSIAQKFDISLNTILIANDLTSKSSIKPGQKLIILPVTGVIYHVKSGDTLGGIANSYKGKTSEIIEINNLSSEGDIFIGDILVIPNGKVPASKPASSPAIPVGSSYFIAPTAKINITQGLHWYNAIDFAAKCGEPVYAAATGTVQKVGYGWNGGAGNYVRIIHPNGVVTTYGHIQTAFVTPGQSVSQGEVIALVGGRPGMAGAGISTGCHVHFDVRGAKNPFQ